MSSSHLKRIIYNNNFDNSFDRLAVSRRHIDVSIQRGKYPHTPLYITSYDLPSGLLKDLTPFADVI